MKSEAYILSMRWGVKEAAIMAWMQARGFTRIVDLMKFSTDHATAMDLALRDFWDWGTA